ncbi:MAG: hypothetical protein C0502_02190 [Opitutus sp.]|nr:hypothetical protein [Opitutus sp.]
MKPGNPRGFALVITLALLALLVLAVLALSALTRLEAQISRSTAAQTQARQNALLALRIALGELQKTAGPDDRVTGMAGLTGIVPQAANSTRHWCGVWRADGGFVAWLASGAEPAAPALQAGASAVALVGSGSVGAAAANSEPVIAGRIAVPGPDGVATGRIAYVVLDEGVKIPAYAPAPVGMAPVIFANATNAQSRLREALATYAGARSKLFSYEQLALLPSPAPALTPSTLQDNFHHVTLGSRTLRGARLEAGLLNVNTNSVHVWRSLLQTYNTSPLAPAQIPAATVSTRGTALQNALPGFATAGKLPRGPFTDPGAVAAFLAVAFTSGTPTAAQIHAVLAPQLAVRSDTFRIRAYGEVASPADPAQAEASVFVEAIVQRTARAAPDGLGRRFTVNYFRWLGPGDI